MTISGSEIPSRLQRSVASALSLVAAVLLSACAAQGPVDTGPLFYPPPPDIPRLQYLTTIANEDDLGKTSDFDKFLLGETQSARRLGRPFAVSHVKGKIYVSDPQNRIPIIIDLVEREFDYIRDMKGGPLDIPVGLFIADNGFKYIADRGRNQVLVYNERDEFHRVYGAEGQFVPLDVAVDGNRVYVCDVADHEIEVLDRETGDVIMKIGERGSDDGYFQSPTHLALDQDGNLYVTDFLNYRVQVFDRQGRHLASIGQLGDLPGDMPRPKGLAVDRDGHLYVVDAAFELVQIFDVKSGQALMGFGKFNQTRSGSWLPLGVHIDYDNIEYFADLIDDNLEAKYLVYVANQAGPPKVNVYAFGDWVGPPPPGARTSAAPGS